MSINEFFYLNRGNTNLIPKHAIIHNLLLCIDSVSEYCQKVIWKNYKIALNLIAKREEYTTPLTGDLFIDENGNLFRIAKFGDTIQFCQGGSFSVGENGVGGVSGTLCSAKIGSVKKTSIGIENLTNTNKTENRKFWFFMDNFPGANRSLSFVCPVKIWKAKC